MICTSIGNMSYEDCRNTVISEDFVELRLDLLDLDPARVKEIFSLPGRKIATCRKAGYSDQERLNLFSTAIASGADFVDLELEMPEDMRKTIIRKAREKQCLVIVSFHNFTNTPGTSELLEQIRSCKEAGADIIKIACRVNEPSDNITLMSLYSCKERLIVIGMGKMGIITRIAGPILGGEFTYAASGQEKKTAEGQLTREEMQQIYYLLDIQ